MRLKAALDHLKKGNRDEALAALVEAWRETRAPAIADLVEKLGPELEKIEQRTAAKTLERLEAVPDDPRLVRQMIDWIRTPPFTSESSRAFWRALGERMIALRDPRLKKAAAELPEEWDRKFSSSFVDKVIRPTLAKVAAADAPAKEVDVSSLAKLVDRPDRGAELLAAIYANPDDDDARQVYGDWLVERGDPRGELIALQSKAERTPAEEKRVAQLLKQHMNEWLGPLAKVLKKETVVFERGFPAKGSVKQSGNAYVMTDAIRERDEWATFRSILCAETLSPKMRGLRRAVVGHPRDVDVDPPLSIEELVCQPAPETLARLKLPRLKRLVLSRPVSPEAMRVVWASPLGKQLAQVKVPGGPTDRSAWPDLPAGVEIVA